MSMGAKCLHCHHFLERRSRMKGRFLCKAFPDGIPMSVMCASRETPCNDDFSFLPHPDPAGRSSKKPKTVESGGHTFRLP